MLSDSIRRLANAWNVRYTNAVNVNEINQALASGQIDQRGVFPRLDELAKAPYNFPVDFGLSKLPQEAGLLLIRGARQYGKSTWLEDQLRSTIRNYGSGSAYYLNGDEIPNARALAEALGKLLPSFNAHAAVRRLFIDEIAAIDDWESVLKRSIDSGELRSTLVVTTGSKAKDLRRGAERLPGRKGRLSRTHYLFTPIPYAAFKRLCGRRLGRNTLTAYLLSGGSPAALGELATEGRLPEYRVASVHDWIYGECSASGRSRASLLSVMEHLTLHGGSPIGQAKLAREAGLANNTVAAGYLDLLGDLLCLGQSAAWDPSKRLRLARKPAKYPFINLLAAVAWHPSRIRSIDDFARLEDADQAPFLEWAVAQEIWRRRAIEGDDFPELSAFWQSKEHELDYVQAPDRFLEVKRGHASALEFSWFPKVFPKGRLTVVNAGRFETAQMIGVTLEDFLT